MLYVFANERHLNNLFTNFASFFTTSTCFSLIFVKKSEDRKRRKKRAKLEMHDLQVFIDGPEVNDVLFYFLFQF